MSRLRIANFLEHYPRPGGTTTAVRGLSRGLARLGWEVVIYCCPGNGQSKTEQESDGVRVVSFSRSRWNLFGVDPLFLKRLSSNQDDIDLLVISGMFNPQCVAVGRAARQSGIPYIVWPHDPYHPELLRKDRWKKMPYGLVYERPFLNAASAIQVLEGKHKVFLSNYGVRTRVLVIPNGFDPLDLAEDEAVESGQQAVREEGLKILYLGRLDMHNKGLDLLLQAFSLGLLHGKLPPNARLDLVGSDWGDRRKLKLLADRLHIGQNVSFLGRISGLSQWRIISSYDFLVLPSRWDGFGLSVLEAMVMAKPVLVSEEAGISPYVRDAECGYLVQPNVDSVYTGLVHAVQTSYQWPSMGSRGREFAYERLTWKNCAERANLCYEEVLHDAKAAAHRASSFPGC